MMSKTQNISDHIGELLSGYIDGELTQQERQRVDVHCDTCEQCRKERDELRQLREQVAQSRLSEYGEDNWRESMNDVTVQTSRGFGWLLLVGGVLAAVGVGVYEFLTDPGIETYAKVIAGAVYGGFAILFVSVLRQRLIERKTDKYKDVEI
jgi:hypothetical protein